MVNAFLNSATSRRMSADTPVKDLIAVILVARRSRRGETFEHIKLCTLPQNLLLASSMNVTSSSHSSGI